MIEVIFTIDYEIFGNGQGSLKDFVYDPAEKLMHLFDEADVRLVVYAEVAEFERIAQFETDPHIHEVEDQMRRFHEKGHELALHLHPQWYRANYKNDRWNLDYSEYNLCTLEKTRIKNIVDRALRYLRSTLHDSKYTPISFRAGNWLFQPTKTAAEVLAKQGIKLDSSVFKGGVQHKHGLDYRPSAKNGFCWEFTDDVNVPENKGLMTEIPIYTRMVPIWKMLTAKRLGLQQKINSTGSTSLKDKMFRLWDRGRLFHPLKFDFCRMTLDELTETIEIVLEEDNKSLSGIKPIVAIGHTKDLVDLVTVELFLDYLKNKGITVSTFRDIYPKCRS